MHVAGVRADATTFEHVDPALVGNARELLVSELAGKRRVAEKARRSGSSSTTRPPARVIERVKELEHQGYQFEAADGSFELLLRQETGEYEPLFVLESWRVIVEQRADGKVETEATIKIWVDGERYVRTAEGNGPVNALDAALRAAIVQVHPHLRGHRARQLQGPHPRRDQGHRRDHARAHRRLRRRRHLGLDRRARERHRRVVAGARRLAGVRRAAPAGGAAPRGRSSAVSAATGRPEVIPLARPVLGEAEEEARSSRSCAPASCRSARACRRSSGASPRASARRTPAPSRAGPPGCTWRCAPSA